MLQHFIPVFHSREQTQNSQALRQFRRKAGAALVPGVIIIQTQKYPADVRAFRKEMRQCFPCHTAQRKIAAFHPVFGIKAYKGQHINGCFKDKELVAVPLIAEITGFIRTAHILPEFIGCSPAVGISGNTGCVLRSSVPSYKHHIVAGVLVNISGSDKGIDNAPVNLSFFCQILYRFCIGGIMQRKPEVRRWGGASVRLACACFAGQHLYRFRE